MHPETAADTDDGTLPLPKHPIAEQGDVLLLSDLFPLVDALKAAIMEALPIVADNQSESAPDEDEWESGGGGGRRGTHAGAAVGWASGPSPSPDSTSTNTSTEGFTQ